MLTVLSLGVVAGCTNGNNNGNSNSGGDSGTPDVPLEFDFIVSLSSGSKTMIIDEQAKVVITAYGGEEGAERKYSYKSSDIEVASVSKDGLVIANGVGTATLTVREQFSEKQQTIVITVIDASPAKGGYNFASLSGEESVKKRTEILGQLEKYAYDNHLTGITLFENGGYVKYSERVTLPTTNYITGYGFGLLSEGTVDADMASEGNAEYKRYLHSAYTTDPLMINARNDVGSQVSDLEGYITSSFWGTKMNAAKDQYVWYPVLAKDKVTFSNTQYDFTRPVPIYEYEDASGVKHEEEVAPNENPNPLGLYKSWRIYVKTGDNGGVKYRYSGQNWNGVNFDKRGVALEDYEFAYRFLLTGSHKLKRGPEMANDQTYGIVGAQAYNTRTEKTTDEEAKEIWNNMKNNGSLGVKTGTDSVNGPYIQLKILNAIDRFTAMYTFSSNLLSPMPEDFIKTIGEGSLADGAQRYGSFNNNEDSGVPEIHQDKVLDFTLSVGPYMLKEWNKKESIVFSRNETWVEENRYLIPGIKLRYIDISSDSTAIYQAFNLGQLDSCGIPQKFLDEEKGKPRVYQTKGDSTFKLNVNSCTQERWDELNKEVWKETKKWKVKPWMSNDNFLTGLFFSINRKQFAEKRGAQPSIDYFSNAYLNDPENGKSYNDSQAHKDAVAAYQTYDSNNQPTYGYNRDKAVLAFKTAVRELMASGDIVKGTRAKPTTITIHIKWMYQTDVKEYGEDIASYFEGAFNDDRVSNGTVKLEVTQDAVTNWQDVYNVYMMKGQFDLGFGAISGNTYNPLNFLEVLKSDNSSGFTLNWGADTSKITTAKPLVYDDKIWSFDALWAAADHGTVVDNGNNINPVKKSFLRVINSSTANNFYNGATFWVPTEFFAEPEGEEQTVRFKVSQVSLYIVGFGNKEVKWSVDEDGDVKVVISPELAAEINAQIRKTNKLDKDDDRNDETPFTLENYDVYWTIEVYYTIEIKDQKTGDWGSPSETYVTAAANEDAWKDKQEASI